MVADVLAAQATTVAMMEKRIVIGSWWEIERPSAMNCLDWYLVVYSR